MAMLNNQMVAAIEAVQLIGIPISGNLHMKSHE